jgi:hypothetical protein
MNRLTLLYCFARRCGVALSFNRIHSAALTSWAFIHNLFEVLPHLKPASPISGFRILRHPATLMYFTRTVSRQTVGNLQVHGQKEELSLWLLAF